MEIKYSYIRIIVIITLFVGLYTISGLIMAVIQQDEGSVVSILHFIVIYSVFSTIFLFGVIPILYLRHIHITKIKKKELPEKNFDIQKKDSEENIYCKTCGAEISDKTGEYCSKCGVSLK